MCPSLWLADCARRSTLMADWAITVIPYPIVLNVWAACDQAQARALLGLPADRQLVLFGAMGGSPDPRKGADLLLKVLQQLELVVFGQCRQAQPPDHGFPIHYSGHLHDDLSLRTLYSAADAMVIPSRQNNLPNTGLPDIVADHVSGALADPLEPASLAAAIRWVLEYQQRHQQLGADARSRAEQLWNPARVAGLYAEVYQQALEAQVSIT